jgi:hypothetical protein
VSFATSSTTSIGANDEVDSEANMIDKADLALEIADLDLHNVAQHFVVVALLMLEREGETSRRKARA